MSSRTSRLSLSVLLALGLCILFATTIALAQGPDDPDRAESPRRARELPPITKENVANFSLEELLDPANWEQLSLRERSIVERAAEAGLLEHAAQDQAQVLSPGVDLGLYIWDESTTVYNPSYEPESYFLYEIWLYNWGQDDATGVRLTYTPPVSALVSGSYNDRALPYSQNGELAWNVGSVESGGDRYFYVEMQVIPTATIGTDLVSTASVTCTQVTTPVLETETDTVAGFNLNVDKYLLRSSPGYMSSSRVTTDSLLTYLIQVENQSVISDGLNVIVTDTLPADATFVGASSGGVYSPTAHEVIWNVGTLGKMQTKSFIVRVQTPVTVGLPLYNYVEASTSIPEARLWDNDSSWYVTTTALEPNVELDQSSYWDIDPAPGTEIGFNVQVETGEGYERQVPLENVVVTQRLEGELTYAGSRVRDWYGEARPATTTVATSGDGMTITWNLGTIPNDPDKILNRLTIDVRARIFPEASAGDLVTATAMVTTTTQPESSIYDNDDQTVVTIIPAYPDLWLSSKSGCASPYAGGWCVYDLWVDNVGTVPITDAVLIDYLPRGLTAFGGGSYDDYSPVVGDAQWGPGTLAFSTQVVTWTLNPIPPDGSAHVELFVRVSDALTVGHVLTNTAVVTRTTILADATPGDNKFTHVTTVVAKPQVTTAELDVYKDDSSPYAFEMLHRPGDAVAYGVSLYNDSSLVAENTVLTDAVLFHATLVTATADEGIDPVIAGNVATWGAGDRSKGDGFYVDVSARIDPGLSAGQAFANLAWASTTTPESYTDDNYQLEYNMIGIPPQEPDVTVDKYLYGCRAPGGVVEFEIDVWNERAITATNVAVTDTLPVGLSAESGQQVVLSLGDMAPDAWYTRYFTATVSPALAPGTLLVNTVQVTAENEDLSDTYNNTDRYRFHVLGSPYADLAVRKEHVDQVIESDSATDWYIPLAYRGRLFDYEIHVDNWSGCPAEDVVLVDILPDGMNFVSASPAPSIRSGQVITWNLGTIPWWGYEHIQITVRPDTNVPAGTFLRNRAYVSSSTYDPNPADNAVTFITGINERAFTYLPLVLRDS